MVLAFSIFLVMGMINLVVGYGLAVYFGYGPPNLAAAWQAIQLIPRHVECVEALGPPVVPIEPLGPPIVPIESFVAPVDPLPVEEVPVASAPDPHMEFLDDSEIDASPILPESMPYDSDMLDAVQKQSQQHWETDAKFVDMSISDLNIAMMKRGARATELDARLRSLAGKVDAASIENCIAQLKEDCETYLTELSEGSERLHNQYADVAELATLREEHEMAALENTAQIETTLSNLHELDYRSNIEAARARLLTELDKLRVARHRWRDTQEATLVAIANHDGNLDGIDKKLQSDLLTGLRNRIGIETILQSWWSEGRHLQRSISAILLDVNRLGNLNQQYGTNVADSVLCQIARFLEVHLSKADFAGRLGGSFLVVLSDVGLQPACHRGEQFRQSIEHMTFKKDSLAVRTTVSGGVGEFCPDDRGPGDLLKRLTHAAKNAKTAGGNCLVLDETHHFSRVQSPQISVEELELAI